MPTHREVSATKTLAGLAPVAVVLVAVGTLVWWLLDRRSALAPWLVAAVLFAHGWVHLVFLVASPERRSDDQRGDNPFDLDRSWLVDRGADPRLLHAVGAMLAVATFVAFAAAALAVLGWLLPAGWWVGLVLVGVAGSTVLLALFFVPTLVLGLVIDAGLLALAIQTSWEVTR